MIRRRRRAHTPGKHGSAAAYDAAVLALAGLQNYWPLNEGSGTTYNDAKGANNATAASAPAWGTGPDGSVPAPDFGATSARVGLPGSAITLPATHTLFYWIKLDSQSAVDNMAVEWATAGFAQYVQHDIGYSGTVTGYSAGQNGLWGAYYGTVAGAAAERELRADFAINTWYFVAVTVDPTLNNTDELRLYKDAVATGSQSGLGTSSHQTGTPGAGVLGIGGRGQGGRNLPLNGSLYGVGLLNRAMTTAEMAALRTAMLG